ncbi:MAG: hypothetical protein P8Z78_00995 [Gammaproteobacteria bacterium]
MQGELACYVGGGVDAFLLAVDTSGTTCSAGGDNDFAFHLLCGHGVNRHVSLTMMARCNWRSSVKPGLDYSDHSWRRGSLETDEWGCVFAGIVLEKFFNNED